MRNVIVMFMLLVCCSCISKVKENLAAQKFGNIVKSELGDLDSTFQTWEGQGEIIPVSIKEDGLDISSLIDSVVLIPLEATDQSLIGGIDKIICTDDRFYILDKRVAKSLFVFDAQGRFVRRIGQPGRGPGEYLEPSDFVVYPKENLIIVFDQFGRQLLYYGTDGTFQRNVRLKYILKEIIPAFQDSLLFAIAGNNQHLEEIAKHDVLLINREGKIISKMLPYEYSLNFSSSNDYQRRDSLLLYHPTFSDKIYGISPQGIRAAYQIDIPNGLPSNFQERCQGDYLNFCNLFKQKYNYLSGGFFDVGNHLLLSIVTKNGKHIYSIYNKQTEEIIAGVPAIHGGGGRPFDIAGTIAYSLSNSFTVYQGYVVGNILSTWLDFMPVQDQKKLFCKPDSLELNGNPVLFKWKLKS